jgi:hypothetical protein
MKKQNSTWYVHQNLKPQGPFTQEEVRAKIFRGEVGPCDLICHDDIWRPASEWGVFEQQLFPAAQGVVFSEESRENVQEWVLLASLCDSSTGVESSRQEGPFSVIELVQWMNQGRVSPYQFVWKNGLSGWCLIKDRPEFRSAMTSEMLMGFEL